MPGNTKLFAENFEIKALSEDGTFEGYASTFGNVDSYGDVIASDAFNSSIREAKKTKKFPKLLWQHDHREPIGIFTEMKKDGNGLLVTGKLNMDVARGKEAYSLLKMGALDSMSIGFSVRNYEIDTQTGLRTITDMKLWEVSIVTFPANEMARITGVKSSEKPQTEREFERFLREEGNFSQSEAKTIIAKGFKSIAQRDVEEQAAAEICRSIEKTLNILR